MSAIRGQMGYVASLSAGEQSFAVICYATRDDVREVFKPGYFQGSATTFFDGDILVTNHVPAKTATNPNPRGCKVVSMIHKNHNGHISLTRLFELPHDPAALQGVLARGFTALAEDRYVPTYLESLERKRAEQAAESEAPAPSTAAPPRGRAQLKQA